MRQWSCVKSVGLISWSNFVKKPNVKSIIKFIDSFHPNLFHLSENMVDFSVPCTTYKYTGMHEKIQICALIANKLFTHSFLSSGYLAMKPTESFGLDSYLEPSTNYDSESEHSEQLTHSRSRILAREATFGYFKDASREDPCAILPQHAAIHGPCLHKY